MAIYLQNLLFRETKIYIYRNLASLAIKFQMHFIDILIHHTCTHTLTFSPFAMFSYMDVVDSGGVDQFSWNPCKSFSEGSCTNAAVSDQPPPNSTPPHPSLNFSDNPHLSLVSLVFLYPIFEVKYTRLCVTYDCIVSLYDCYTISDNVNAFCISPTAEAYSV